MILIASIQQSVHVISSSSESIQYQTSNDMTVQHLMMSILDRPTQPETEPQQESRRRKQVPTRFFSLRNRPEVDEILQHPHKSSPCSRSTGCRRSDHGQPIAYWPRGTFQAGFQSNTTTTTTTKSGASKNSSAYLWLPHRTTRTIPNVARNVHRVQDFLESAQHQQAQAPRKTQQQTTQTNAPNTKDDHKPLNIVLFYADDWTMQVLGALNPHVHTPNIDAMAERGMLFTRNCVTTSICWISRNTLATGAYASVHGNVQLGSENMFGHSQFAWTDTLYPLLKQKGNYFTGLVGKWHAPSPPEHMKVSFDVLKIYYGDHWMERKGKQRHVTDLNGEDALAFLNLWNTKHRFSAQQRPDKNDPKQDERPFFLKVSFFATHARDYQDPPYQPMNESFALYRNVTIPRPHTATEQHYQALPKFMKSRRNEARHRNTKRFDTDENYQINIKNLFRMATEVDAVVGAVIAQLQELQAYDNTLLIFTTDNGNLHGEHGLTEKWYPYEESIRVPLVIQDPRMSPEWQGVRNTNDFTLNLDLAPTILTAAQIPIPPHMQGRDLSQLYRHRSKDMAPYDAIQASWRQDFFYEWNTVCSCFSSLVVVDCSLCYSRNCVSEGVCVFAAWLCTVRFLPVVCLCCVSLRACLHHVLDWIGFVPDSCGWCRRRQGEPVKGDGHIFHDQVLPAVFALIRKDYKYFYWPEFDNEQLFHIEQDPYEESDIFTDNSTTTQQALHVMKARYKFLKEWTQTGNPV